MEIKSAEFVISNTKIDELPAPKMPEYAFVGRSNVGKSSLINALTNRKKLAKTSGTPGKTQLINHFLVNGAWYLVDLPGYGFAKVSKKDRAKFDKMIHRYVMERKSLMNVFVLVDSKIPPQASDLEFMEFLGVREIPFSIVFTKMDKLNSSAQSKNLRTYEEKLLEVWESLPPMFYTSAADKRGMEDVLDYIEECNGLWKSI